MQKMLLPYAKVAGSGPLDRPRALLSRGFSEGLPGTRCAVYRGMTITLLSIAAFAFVLRFRPARPAVIIHARCHRLETGLGLHAHK